LEDFESTVPKPESFEGSEIEMPFVILGNEAYPLKTYLMKTFAKKDLPCKERVLNYGLLRARRCVECTFGILRAKWRLLNKAIETNVNKAERIVRCNFLLHNIIIDLEGTTHDHSVLQETSQIRGSRQTKTNVSGSSTVDIDIRGYHKYCFFLRLRIEGGRGYRKVQIKVGGTVRNAL
jgi:hypothetical protein